jgi:hypothetical protein
VFGWRRCLTFEKNKNIGIKIKNPCELNVYKGFSLNVIRIGLEPMTYCLEGSCSIQLSYRTVSSNCAANVQRFFKKSSKNTEGAKKTFSFAEIYKFNVALLLKIMMNDTRGVMNFKNSLFSRLIHHS